MKRRQPDVNCEILQNRIGSDGKASGHGRNNDAAFETARKVETRNQQLKSGDRLLHGVAGEPG